MPLAISNHALRAGGGIERYALTLVRGLHACGVRPVMIAKTFDATLEEYQWVEPIAVPVSALPGKLRDAWFDWRLRVLKRRQKLFPLIACNQTGAADIGICGGTHPGFLAAMGQRAGPSDWLKVATERAHLKASRIVVAHSQRMADEVQRHYGIAPSKIRLLYPPVDGERFYPVDDARRAALRRTLGLPQDRAVFLLASTGHRRKGLDLLAEAFERSTLPVCLAVAGRPTGRPDTLRLRSLGYRRDIENVYRAVDFTVLASRYEPFGLVGVESVLCGTPVLVARNVGCAEVIRQPASLLFELGSEASLAAAIQTGVSRWALGRARVTDPYAQLGYDSSVAQHVCELLALCKTLLTVPQAAP